MRPSSPINVTESPAPTVSPAAGEPSIAGEREAFLDGLRALAIVRVILWHAFGAAAITYVVSAVPAMFFVTGSLLARSLDRRPARVVIVDRLRRLLVPLWVFATVAFAVMTLADRVGRSPTTVVPWRAVLWWVIPLDDPQGSVWQGGWLASPLWYLRALTWLFLAAPLLRAALRRAPTLTMAVPVGLVFLLDWLSRSPRWNPPGPANLTWLVGDAALYAVFLLLGFLHRDGQLARVPPGGWLALASLGGVASTAWILTQPVPDHVVNNSHPAHLLVGLSWLCVALAARPLIELLATRGTGRDVVRWITRRSMTTYLWHSAGIAVAYHLLRGWQVRLPFGLFSVCLLALTFSWVLLAAVLFGWAEDLAARRPQRLWPEGRMPIWARSAGLAALGSLVVVGLDGFNGLGTSPAAQALPRVPSQAPHRPTFTSADPAAATTLPVARAQPAFVAATAGAVDADDRPARRTPPASAAELAPPASADTAAALAAAVNDYLATYEITGAQVGVLRPGRLYWSAAAGSGVKIDDHFDMNSITKTFTAALIFREIEAGRLTLDGALPPLRKVPELPSDRLTVRELLTHSTGLVNYRDTPDYEDPEAVATPVEALAASSRQPLAFEPGTTRLYSSSNYLALGLLLEQVTGRSYDDLLRGGLLEPLGLDHITHTEPQPGWPNFSTGGLVTDVDALLRWGVALLRDQVVVSSTSFATMSAIDPDSALGAGLWGYCPCRLLADGSARFEGLGHSGGQTQLEYLPAADLIVVVNLSDPLPATEEGENATAVLADQLRAIVDGETQSEIASAGATGDAGFVDETVDRGRAGWPSEEAPGDGVPGPYGAEDSGPSVAAGVSVEQPLEVEGVATTAASPDPADPLSGDSVTTTTGGQR